MKKIRIEEAHNVYSAENALSDEHVAFEIEEWHSKK